MLILPTGNGTHDEAHEPTGQLGKYDFETLKYESLADGVSSFEVSRDGKQMIYRSRNRLRVFRAGEKPGKLDSGDRPNRETGWLDLGRVKISVLPALEWRQMFAEAWRLQRDYFWTEDMSGVDWQAAMHVWDPTIVRVFLGLTGFMMPRRIAIASRALLRAMPPKAESPLLWLGRDCIFGPGMPFWP
jgi:tricorn protease